MFSPPQSTSAEYAELLSSGQQALRGAEWLRARQAFAAALRAEETPEALEGLASAAWWLDDADRVLEAREQAYRLYRQRGEPLAAARLAIALSGDYLGFRGQPAIAQGWQQRARELLLGNEHSAERGWLELTLGDFALSVHTDPAAAAQSAELARAIGQSLGAEDIRVLASALLGAAWVVEGRVEEGLRELDGAVTSALSGDVRDPIAIGYSCCHMLRACERARDFDRATQWCERVRAFSERAHFDALLAVCRAHHASLAIGRGQWVEAEAELGVAARQLAASRPGLLGEALLRLARLRRLQGRAEEASDLLQQLNEHPAALGERAELALDAGDPGTALALAERLVRRIPERNQTDRASVLELRARAELALADHGAAERTLGELRPLCVGRGGTAEAALQLCEGQLARLSGDAEGARRALEDAVDGFRRCQAPFELARAQFALGRELCETGHCKTKHREAKHRELGLAEVHAAGRAFEQLGARADLLGVERWLAAAESSPLAPAERREPCEPELSARAAASELSRRELDVLRWVARGLSNRAIASELGVSEFTVKRHVQNLLGKLGLPTRAAAASHAARLGLL